MDGVFVGVFGAILVALVLVFIEWLTERYDRKYYQGLYLEYRDKYDRCLCTLLTARGRRSDGTTTTEEPKQ